MSKKFLLIVSLCGLMMLIAACGGDDNSSSGDEDEITLRVNHAVDNNHPYQHGIEKFKEIVEEELEGRVNVEIYNSGQLGTDRESIEGMQNESLEMAVTSSAPVAGFVPEIAMFDLPYLFESNEHAYEILDGEVGDYYNDLLLEEDIVNLGWFENGFRHITNSQGPIESPDDLEGLKIRVMENEVAVETFNTAGAIATPMEWGEVFTALEQGTIDAQENPIPVIYGQGLYEVQDYMTLSKHFYSPALLMIGKDTFDRFTDEEKEFLREAGKEATEHQRQVSQDQNEEFLGSLEEEGMEISEVDVNEFREAMQPVYDQFGDEFNQDILDQVLGN